MCRSSQWLTTLRFVVYCLTLHKISAYGTGAPSSRCGSLTPGHPATGQPLPGPYTISLSKDNYIPFEVVDVTIESPDSLPFSGFLIQSVDANNISNYVGTFQPETETKFVCGQHGLTHTSGTLKDSKTFKWRAPLAGLTDVVFRATVVRDYFTFYIDIRSVVLKKRVVDTTTTTTTSTSSLGIEGSTSMTTTTTALTSSTLLTSSLVPSSSTISLLASGATPFTSVSVSPVTLTASVLSTPVTSSKVNGTTTPLLESSHTKIVSTSASIFMTLTTQTESKTTRLQTSQHEPPTSSSLHALTSSNVMETTVSSNPSPEASSGKIESTPTSQRLTLKTDNIISSTTQNMKSTHAGVSPSPTTTLLAPSTSAINQNVNAQNTKGNEAGGSDSSDGDVKLALILSTAGVWLLVVTIIAVVKYRQSAATSTADLVFTSYSRRYERPRI